MPATRRITGKSSAWDNPPSTGHPGEEFKCRCTAEPVEIDASPLELLALLSGVGIVRTVGVRVGAAILRRIGRGLDKPAPPKPRSVEESPIDILKPNGQPIGRQGMRKEIRMVKGGEKEAQELFKKLTKGGTEATPAGYSGRRVRMPNGDLIGYRAVSKSGSPTIDLKVQGVEFQKIHFYQ